MSATSGSPRRRLLSAALVVGIVGTFLFLMLLWAGLFKDDVDQSFFGVAYVNGELYLVSCDGTGVGSAQFRAQGPDGPLLLELKAVDTESADAVPLTRAVDGYTAVGSLATGNGDGDGDDFYLTSLKSGTQKDLLFALLKVDPSGLTDGSIAVHRDHGSRVIPYSEFQSEYPNCGLPR